MKNEYLQKKFDSQQQFYEDSCAGWISISNCRPRGGTDFEIALHKMCQDFSRYNWSGINMDTAYLEFTDFSQSKLTGISAMGTKFLGADLSGSDLSGAILDEIDISYASLALSNLSDASLKNVNWEGANLKKADLSNVNLSYSYLENVNFTHAKLDGACLLGSRFLTCDFTGASLNGVDLSGVKFDKATRQTNQLLAK